MVTNYRMKKGFTIIELIVAVTVIGIIASVVTANLSESRARARDASRQEGVRQYSSSMELVKASTGTYFVYNKAAGVAPVCSYSTESGNGFMACTGVSAVGFQGGGAGGMTRKKTLGTDTSPASYSTVSVADALVSGGYLAQVRLDPLEKAFNTNTNSTSVYSDFILTYCKSNSAPADSIKNTQEYAIYTELERPTSTSQDVANTHCGGPSTPTTGWNTLISR
jgi:prepilin-type N-terminal cleavage/methylation domain-containing protein